MKKFFALMLLISVSACTLDNEHGRCIGIAEKENPNLDYEFSAWNIVWTALFVQSLFAPAVWIFRCAKCPTGKKLEQPSSR